MTGLLGCMKALALPAVAACGVLIGQVGFDGGTVDTSVKTGAGSRAGVSADEAKPVVNADADASFAADVTAQGWNGCAGDCAVPCTSGCVPPAPVAVESDAELEGGLTVALEQEPGTPCGCPTTGPALEIKAAAEAGAEADASTEDGEIGTEAGGSLTADAGPITISTSGSATIDVDGRLD